MPEADVEDEVTSILTDIDLLDKADAIAEKLSGGQKRKLSVGELSQMHCFGSVSGLCIRDCTVHGILNPKVGFESFMETFKEI
jgi:hypothetical protein